MKRIATPALSAAFAAALLAGPRPGAAATLQIPSGFAVVSAVTANLDGTGRVTACIALPAGTQGSPRLWIYRGATREFEWVFSRHNAVGALTGSTAVLESRDLTGDGRPELVVRVLARGGAASAATYLFGWDGSRYRNLVAEEFSINGSLIPARCLAHGPQGAVTLAAGGTRRPVEPVVWDFEPKGPFRGRVIAQYLRWNGKAFVLGKTVRSGRAGKEGLVELGLVPAPRPRPTAPPPAAPQKILVRAAQQIDARPICDRD